MSNKDNEDQLPDALPADSIDPTSGLNIFSLDIYNAWIELRKTHPDVTLDNIIQLYKAQQLTFIGYAMLDVDEKLAILAEQHD